MAAGDPLQVWETNATSPDYSFRRKGSLGVSRLEERIILCYLTTHHGLPCTTAPEWFLMSQAMTPFYGSDTSNLTWRSVQYEEARVARRATRDAAVLTITL